MAKTQINKNGYLVFSDNPNNLVHRWVAKKKYEEDWREDFEVHHIDGDKLNNDKSNLIQMNNEDHHQLHQHENKKNFLSGLIITFSVSYFLALTFFGFVFTSLNQAGLNIMRWSVILILVSALELRYNLVARVIRRPNERLFKEKKK